MNQNELNNTIANYQTTKASCESELNKLSTDLAIANNNLQATEQQALQMFGTSDINALSTQLQNLTTEQQALEQELNLLNNEQ